MTTPVPVGMLGARLGECPVWHPGLARVFWLDLTDPALLSFDPATGQDTRIPIAADPPVGGLAVEGEAGLIFGHRGGIDRIDPATGQRRFLTDPLAGLAGVACNDMAVDRSGQLWLSTVEITETEPLGGLMRWHGGTWSVAERDVIVGNGPAVSADGRTLYFSDTMAGQILRYRLTPAGRLAGRETFATFAADEGLPDGLALDADGFLWVGHWNGARISRIAPDGQRSLTIPIPARHVTACCFAGPDRRAMYITTAAEGMSADERAALPLSGRLFHMLAPVAGQAPGVLSL